MSRNSRIRNNKLYNRCPVCSSYLRTSIPEKILYYYLIKIFPKTIANYKPEWLKPKELDIFIPELNIGIEYDGYYYHKDYKKDLDRIRINTEIKIKELTDREKLKRDDWRTRQYIENIVRSGLTMGNKELNKENEEIKNLRAELAEYRDIMKEFIALRKSENNQ